MDINQIRFGNYPIGDSRSFKGKGDKKESENLREEKGAPAKEVRHNSQNILNALDKAGNMNRAQILGTKEIKHDPSVYLNNERIKDIEAAMAEFERETGKIAQTIEKELPGVLTAAQRNALAAQMFAQE